MHHSLHLKQIFLGLALTAGLGTLASCKSASGKQSSLKGVTASDLNTADSANYMNLVSKTLPGLTRPLKMTFFFTYEEFHTRAAEPASPSATSAGALNCPDIAAENEATVQARCFVAYVSSMLCNGAPMWTQSSALPSDVVTPSDTVYSALFTLNTNKCTLGAADKSQWSDAALPSSIALPTGSTLEVILGRSINTSVVLSPSFMGIIAHAFLESDITMYSGHVWEYSTSDTDVTSPLEAGQNTANLVNMIGQIAPTGRASQGVLYMNVCKSEKIESSLMKALSPGAAQDGGSVVLMSNRYFNTYGRHSRQAQFFLNDILTQVPLPNLMVDLMGDLEYRLQLNNTAKSGAAALAKAYTDAITPTPGDQLAQHTSPAAATWSDYCAAQPQQCYAWPAAAGSIPMDNATVVVVRQPGDASESNVSGVAVPAQ